MDLLTFFGVPAMAQAYIHIALGALVLFWVVALGIVTAFPSKPTARGTRKARTAAMLLVLLMALVTMPLHNWWLWGSFVVVALIVFGELMQRRRQYEPNAKNN